MDNLALYQSQGQTTAANRLPHPCGDGLLAQVHDRIDEFNNRLSSAGLDVEIAANRVFGSRPEPVSPAVPVSDPTSAVEAIDRKLNMTAGLIDHIEEHLKRLRGL